MGALDEVERMREKIVLDGFHPLASQRSGIIDDLFAHFAKAGILSGIVHFIASPVPEMPASSSLKCE